MKNKQVLCYLMYSALSEIQLSLYSNANQLKVYDPVLHTRHKKLKINFEKVSKRVFGTFSEEEQKQFFNMVNIFEKLIESSADHEKFVSLMVLIEEFQNGEIKVIEG